MGEDDKPPIAAKTRERPFWVLDSQEQRLLWITFVGGVASIVVSAAILGVAVALARWFVARNTSTFAWINLVFLLVCGSFLTFLMIRWRIVPRRWLRWVAAIFFLIFATVILVWIGIAAGVK